MHIARNIVAHFTGSITTTIAWYIAGHVTGHTTMPIAAFGLSWLLQGTTVFTIDPLHLPQVLQRKN